MEQAQTHITLGGQTRGSMACHTHAGVSACMQYGQILVRRWVEDLPATRMSRVLVCMTTCAACMSLRARVHVHVHVHVRRCGCGC